MNKTVFVTGACYGTGYAIAERFAEEGWNVLISGRDQQKVDSAAKSLSEKYGITTHGYVTTTFDQEEVRSIFADMRTNSFWISSPFSWLS